MTKEKHFSVILDHRDSKGSGLVVTDKGATYVISDHRDSKGKGLVVTDKGDSYYV